MDSVYACESRSRDASTEEYSDCEIAFPASFGSRFTRQDRRRDKRVPMDAFSLSLSLSLELRGLLRLAPRDRDKCTGSLRSSAPFEFSDLVYRDFKKKYIYMYIYIYVRTYVCM